MVVTKFVFKLIKRDSGVELLISCAIGMADQPELIKNLSRSFKFLQFLKLMWRILDPERRTPICKAWINEITRNLALLEFWLFL